MVTIATIVLGVSFLFAGGAIVARLSALLQRRRKEGSRWRSWAPGSTGETLAGITGIVLGILGLAGHSARRPDPVCRHRVRCGAGDRSGANIRIREIVMAYRQELPVARQVARQSVLATTGVQVLAGLGAVTLGIIALAGMCP